MALRSTIYNAHRRVLQRDIQTGIDFHGATPLQVVMAYPRHLAPPTSRRQLRLRSTPAEHKADIIAAGQELMSRAGGRIDAAAEAFKREQNNLAGVIGTVRDQRTQREWLAITAAAAPVVGLLSSPFAARLLPFGWDAGVAATILHADRWSAGQALMKSTNPTGWAALASEINRTFRLYLVRDRRQLVRTPAKAKTRCAGVWCARL